MSFYNMALVGWGGGGYIMAWGGVVGLSVVYHGFRWRGYCVLPLHIMALGGVPQSCNCISWL